MNRRHIWQIFRKEFIDLLRDRKTWVGAFVIPIVVIPLVFILINSSISSVEREARENVSVGVIGDANHPLIKQFLELPGTALAQVADPLEALKQNEVRAVIELPAELDEELQKGGTVTLSIWYDPSNQKSGYARELLEQTIADYEKGVVDTRLQAVNLSPDAIHPIETEVNSVASDEKMTGSMLASIIPLMLVISIASGGIPAATDLIAGEKERGTLETLLTSPVAGSSILTAKLFTVMLMSGVSGLASLISMSIVFGSMSMGMDSGSFSLGFLQPFPVMILLLMVIFLAAMFAGFELTLSTLAKSFKEAQTYMTPILFVAMVPAYMLMFINPQDIPVWYYVLPVFNSMAIFKEVFYGEVVMMHAGLAIISSLVYVGIAVGIASRFFRKESLLTR